MIQSIRRRHAYFFVFLSVFLPLVAILALYFKVDLEALQSSKNNEKQLVNHGTLLFDSSDKKEKNSRIIDQQHDISVQVFDSSSKKKERIFVIRPHKPIKLPDVLVYLSKLPLKSLKNTKLHKKLNAAVLLGELVGDATQMFTVDANLIKKFKFLIFYSKPFSKVTKEIRFNLKG